MVEECEITKMVAAIDPKTREKKKVRRECSATAVCIDIGNGTQQYQSAFALAHLLQAKFVKSGSMCIARIVVEKPICIEPFDSVPQVRRRWHFEATIYLVAFLWERRS